MSVEEAVRDRIQGLIKEAEGLRHGDQFGEARSDDQMQRCAGWIASALHVVQLIVPNPESAYRKRAEEIASREVGHTIQSHVGEFLFLLKNLISDVDAGLLTSVADRARAETFDNFLDHAKEYLSNGRKKEAGVISGVVFEDSLRRMCRKHGLREKDEKIDTLISALAKADVISQAKAKRARAAAHVRTKATHAQWDEFEENDVKVTIEFTEELILSQLDG